MPLAAAGIATCLSRLRQARHVFLLLLALLLALLPLAASAATADEKVQSSSLDGLAFQISLSKPKKNAKVPAELSNLATDGHTCVFQGGKIQISIKGLPAIPPLTYQATRSGDMIRIACADPVDVIDKANKSTEIGTLAITGTISNAGKSFIGELNWKVGEGKKGPKVDIAFTGQAPEKPEKPAKPAKP